MAVDEKRAQIIFLAAVEVADPSQQTALLDRECGSQSELRGRVEALLLAYRQSATVITPGAKPHESAGPPLDRTVEIDSGADRRQPSRAAPALDAAADHEEQKAGEEQPLEFLEPSTKPGSLGRLGHNEVLEVLGRGGFGIVVRAFDESLHRMVAIKVLAPQLASTSPARKRFLREARASARVRHGNVVQIYAVEERPLPYLVMEFIPGETLQHKLDQTGPLEVPDILRIGAQIARGLAAAHEQGLIHRDIKPANILLENGIEQNVKITDFGLARAADDASMSQSGTIAGTPLYMAPEQAKGDPPDPRADLFSLGSVLYTMASGRPPFRAANPLAVLKRVAEDTPRPIRQIIPEVPQWLCDLITRLHAKEPAERFQSAAEVAALLEQFLAHVQQPTLVARPQTANIGQQKGRRTMAVLGLAAAVVAVVGALGTYPLWRPAAPPPVTAGQLSPDRGAEGTPAPVNATAPNAAAAQSAAAAEPLPPLVLQGRAAVRDALVDFSEPERSFGAAGRDNAVRRAEQCNAFLVHFDLAKLQVPRSARAVKATVSFFVWDPSSMGKTKVCAFPLKTEWDEVSVTWREAAAGRSWLGQEGFAFGTDTGSPGPGAVVEPEHGSDTADPPIEYQLDVTDIVRSWLDGTVPNHGLAIAPVIDPGADGGILSRFQVYGSEHSEEQYTPKLTVQVQP
jgi:hypothetical protein